MTDVVCPPCDVELPCLVVDIYTDSLPLISCQIDRPAQFHPANNCHQFIKYTKQPTPTNARGFTQNELNRKRSSHDQQYVFAYLFNKNDFAHFACWPMKLNIHTKLILMI